MSTAAVIDEQDASLDDLLAVFDEMDAREDAGKERERLQQLGAPAHVAFDLSDAAHDCVSDDSGSCATCAAGGTPLDIRHVRRAKYL